jgi:hypothetical protein
MRTIFPFMNLEDEFEQIGFVTFENVTGDITISEGGVSAIGADKVTNAMLASTTRPAYIVVAAGVATMTNGVATKDVTVTGVQSTDILMGTINVNGGSGISLKSVAYKSADTITITLSDNATTGDKVFYEVLRAVS